MEICYCKKRCLMNIFSNYLNMATFIRIHIQEHSQEYIQGYS